MEIFYLNKKEFLETVNIQSLMKFSDGREYKSEDKLVEHLCGLFLTKFLAKNVYNIENTDIELVGKKPYFTNRKLYFSISHSNDIVLVAFNKTDIGADVEYMQNRDFGRVMSRYGNPVNCESKIDFYKFWTKHEAQIKLGTAQKSGLTIFLNQDYIVSCACEDVMITNLSIKEVVFKGMDVDLEHEFNSPTKFQVNIEATPLQ